MARKLEPEENQALVEQLEAQSRLQLHEELLQGWIEKRDALLWMTPELRAYFQKDPDECVLGS